MVNGLEKEKKLRSGGHNVFVVIVAAGSGTRFGSSVPKQFLPLNGRPVLMHTVDAFREAIPECKILLVLSDSACSYWDSLCEAGRFMSPDIVLGGNSRTASVANALNAIRNAGFSSEDIIMIHDGARPLVSNNLIQRIYEAVESGYDAVVPGFVPTDAMCEGVNDIFKPVDRSLFRSVQTPQAFRAETIMRSYFSITSECIAADDATIAVEYGNASLHIIEGERENIKITGPSDLDIAEVLLRHRRS